MSKDNKIIIKKYPNRRLYDTSISEYITIDSIAEMIKKDVDLVILDAKTGDDLTRITLTQIILDQEMKGYNLMPIELIKQFIKFSNLPANKSFSEYLLKSLQLFNYNFNDVNTIMTDLFEKSQNDWKNQIDKLNMQNSEILSKIFKKPKKK